MNSKPIPSALLLCALALLVSCQTEETPQTTSCPVKPGAVVVVRDTLVPDGVLALGTAEALRRADLSTRLMGKVLSVAVNEGATVQAGQVLAKIEAGEMLAKYAGVSSALAGVEAQAELARTHARRMRALYADSAATKASLEMAEADLRRAEAALAQVHAQGAEVLSVSGYANLTAPFTGRLTRRWVDPGAMASPGAPLLTVEDISLLRVRVNAAPEAVAALRIGTPVHALVGGRDVMAKVEGIVPAPVGNLLVVNALVANTDGTLPSGVSASLLLPRGERMARLIPTAALRHEGDLVGVTVRKGTCDVLRWVRTGISFGNEIEVLAGLKPGEKIVVAHQIAEK